MEMLSIAQRRDLETVFNLFAMSDSAHLNETEFSALSKFAGEERTRAEVADLFRRVGGKMDFHEFVHVMLSKGKGTGAVRRELEQVFMTLDRDGDGVISPDDLTRVTKEAGAPLDPLTSKEFFDELGSKTEGGIRLDGFLEAMST